MLTSGLIDTTSVTTPATSIDHTNVMNVVKDSYITKILLGICHAIQDRDLSNALSQIAIRLIREKITSIDTYGTTMLLTQIHL
jgi:hypothetical protein